MNTSNKKSQRFTVKREHRLFNVFSSSPAYPAVETLTLVRCKDLSPFLSAINSILDANPALSGYATLGTHAVTGQKGPCVVPNHYSFEDICRVVHWPSDQGFDVPSDLKGMMRFVFQSVKHLVPDLGTGSFQLKNGSRLFAVTVIDQLPYNYAVLHISVSHAIADAYTYYKIITQINEVMKNGKIETSLRWDDTIVIQDEGPKLSWYALLLMTIFFCVERMISLYNTMMGTVLPADIAILDNDVVLRLKTSMKQSDSIGYYLTTNDILCSAIAYKAKADISISVINLRQRLSLTNMAGNHISYSVGYKCHHPDSIRRSVKEMKGFQDMIEIAPPSAVATSSVAFITNWTSLCQFIEIPCEDYCLLCHFPTLYKDGLALGLWNVVWAFKATKDKVCVVGVASTIASITGINDTNDQYGQLFV